MHDSRSYFWLRYCAVQVTIACFCVLLNSHSFHQHDKSALQVWGIPSDQRDQDVEVEDEEKEAFRAHVEALFADVL